MPLVVVGLNHKTADIAIRESVSINETMIDTAINSVCARENISSCAILSTCNRTEFYFSCVDSKTATESFCQYYQFDYNTIKNNLYTKENIDCIEHLFSVASGLDSMVLGEAEILGQVKSAYELSRKNNKLDKTLDRLFQKTFSIAKLVRSTTDIGKNPVSIANSAVLLSKQIIGELSHQNILMIGAGVTAQLLLRYLSKHDYHQLSICNRKLDNAKKLANEFNCNAFALSQLTSQIADYDLIFTATSSQTPLIDATMIKSALKIRKHKPMVIIDIAIPRDVDESVKKFNDVFYYEVDDLQKVISKNLQSREKAAMIGKQIIEVETEKFCYWLKAQNHTQLIHNFQKETAKIRKHSLDKALLQLNNGKEIEEVLFSLANNLTKKLNHKPVKAIRTAIQSGDDQQIENIINLLELDNE